VIRIRTILSGQRHALAILGTIIALALAVTLAHGLPGQNHMGGMDESDGSHDVPSAVISVCLAVVEVGVAGAALLGWRLLVRRRGNLPRRIDAWPGDLFALDRRLIVPKARAGPAKLQVFRL
jgi:hypothetical protein